MRYCLGEIASLTGGVLVGADNIVCDIIFDSRAVFKDNKVLFVALRGSIFDGHNFSAAAAKRGVISFMVEHLEESDMIEGCSYVVVKSTRKALQQLANYHRSQLSYPVVAITGSRGKTSVKEWAYHLFSSAKVYRSPRSYNSQLGVPLSVLMMPTHCDMAIIEAGVSKPNEMSALRSIIEPDVVVFTNLGLAHSSNFTDKEEHLLEKLILARSAKRVIYNEQYSFSIAKHTTASQRFMWGWGEECDLRIVSIEGDTLTFTYLNNSYSLTLPDGSAASVENIMSAVSLAAVMTLPLEEITQKTKDLQPLSLRLEMLNGTRGSKIVFDSRNDDLNTLAIALNHLNSVAPKQRRCVILSDLDPAVRGTKSNIYKDIATLLNNSSVEHLITVGEDSALYMKQYFTGELSSYLTTEEMTSAFCPSVIASCAVLVKGAPLYCFSKVLRVVEEKQHTTVMEVNTDALIHNYKYYKSLLKPTTKLVAMVKAMSYGSGMYEVAQALQLHGVDYLAVAYIDEGVALRKRGIHTPIIILNSNPNDYDEVIKYHLEPEIYSMYSLIRFVSSCQRAKQQHYPIHIKLDTGMHRMGFEPEVVGELKAYLNANSEVNVASCFSHFSSCDDATLDSTSQEQIDRFSAMSALIANENTLKHLCNSVGTIRFPEAHFDMVRVGLGLYGISSICQDKLQNVNALYTHILQIKHIKKGEYVGYNMKSVASRDMTIATLSIGYADGFSRQLGCGTWSVTVNGHKAPTFGNISMDTSAIDITGIEASEGDRVAIFQNDKEINLMAQLLGTIPYEVLTSISSRIKRVYITE